MAIQAVKLWPLIAVLLYKVHDVNAVLTVSPADKNATVGSQVRLSCSTDARKEVNWQYGEELNSVIDVYIAKEGLSRQYEKTNRHRVDVDTTVGQYDLVISNVTQEDDGFYICSEPGLWGTPPHARLTITGGELPAKVCRENVIATKGFDLGITFSTCSPEPYYISYVPVGLSHSNDVYNLGKLLNNYADSGRFAVDIASEGLKLKVTNILLSDAGTYTCRGDSGRGDRHSREFVVLDGMPTCVDNISNVQCIETTTLITEVHCAVNYSGNCAPYSIWRYDYGNKSNSQVQQVFTCFNQTYSRVELKAIITIENGVRLICHIEDTSQDAVQKFQCNTSVVPEQCKDHQQNGTSNNPTSNDSSKTMLIALIAIPLIGVFVAGVTWCMYIRRNRESNVPLSEMDALAKQRCNEQTTEENEQTEGHSQCAKHLNGV